MKSQQGVVKRPSEGVINMLEWLLPMDQIYKPVLKSSIGPLLVYSLHTVQYTRFYCT